MKRIFSTAGILFLFLASLIVGPMAIIPHAKASGAARMQESPATAPVWMVEGSNDGFELGSTVSSAGDVNGDGYEDVIVGVPLSGWPAYINAGSVQLYLGSANGVSTYPAWSGSSNQGSANYGYSIDCAGDVNGDGYGDIIIGAPYLDNGEYDEGRAYVYYGSELGLKGSPDWVAENNQPEAWFGYSVSRAGDFNGDGYDDVLVGAPRYHQDEYTANQGRVYVYFGSSQGLKTVPEWTYSPDQSYAWLGETVGSAGDVNGDGYDDVLANDSIGGSNGRAMIFFGGSGIPANVPGWVVEGGNKVSNYDWPIAGGMDVNGDGYGDVIVGGLRKSGTAEYYVNGYYGSAGGPGDLPDWTVSNEQDASAFGISVSGAGDFNGDGYDDVVIGAPTYANGEYDEGKVYVYYGSSEGLVEAFGWAVEGNIEEARFGASVDAVGKGFTDLIIGAPLYSNASEYRNGAAYLFLGSHPRFMRYLPIILQNK